MAKRQIGSTAKKEISADLKQAAVTFFVKNKESNAAKGAADKARKELYGGMKKEGLKSFDFETNIDGSKVILDVSVSSGSQETADVEALYGLLKSKQITEAQFLSVIKAGKGDVEAKLGKDIFARCCKHVSTAENAHVKAKA